MEGYKVVLRRVCFSYPRFISGTADSGLLDRVICRSPKKKKGTRIAEFRNACRQRSGGAYREEGSQSNLHILFDSYDVSINLDVCSTTILGSESWTDMDRF